MAFERAQRLAGLQVPEPQRSVTEADTARRPSGVTATARRRSYGLRTCAVFGRSPGPRAAASGPSEARHGPAPIGRYRHGTDPVGMAFERTQCLAAPSPIAAVFGHTRPTRHGASALPPRPMTGPYGLRACEHLAALQIPEPQRSVTRGRHGPAPIGRYRNALTCSSYGLRACAVFGRSPSPRAAAFGHSRPNGRRPSGVTARALTCPYGLASVRTVWPCSKSQTRSVRS